MGFLNSLFGSKKTGKQETPQIPSIENMSLEQIVAFTQEHLRTQGMSASLGIDLVQRLYTIALYDHHIDSTQREHAARMLAALKQDLESAHANDPNFLEAFHRANEMMEQDARFRGIGSLAWLIEEENVSNSETVPFIMRPEHGHLLGDFLSLLPPETISQTRLHLVRQLILSRRYSTCTNAVLTLHGLVAKGDSATLAVFTTAELLALLRVPDSYATGRDVLVQLGLLPVESNARPFVTSLDQSSLMFLMVRMCIDRDKEAKVDARLTALPEEHRTLVLLALAVLRIHLIRRTVQQVHGENAASAFLSIYSEEVGNVIGRFEEILAKLETLPPGTPIDFALLDQFLEMTGDSPKSEEEFERNREWIEMATAWLNYERVCVQEYARYLLRLNPDVAPPEVRSGADAAIVKFVLETYLKEGSRAGLAEHIRPDLEDWIGEAT
ncbi:MULTISPECIES: hypothetical protein [unclassified Burkholderia]|uniref:hypothetical protein n=1 Tax=unclassified Burkholderia TaxID=2613784 RepID=UPI002AAF8EF7|nr:MULTISPECIES: hypothetical protein [unclassified Burkholderia]